MDNDVIQKIADEVKKYPEVTLVMLFGSRARGDASVRSDWDFGFCAAKGFDYTALYVALTHLLATDSIDLVNLAKASGLLRYRVAKEGKPLYEKQAGEYEKFWLEAVDFWCDAGGIIRAEYEALLRRIA